MLHYNRKYDRPVSHAQIKKESRKAQEMYRDAMNPDVPTDLGDLVPRKEDEVEEPVQRRISEYVVEINGKYRTVDYPPPCS